MAGSVLHSVCASESVSDTFHKAQANSEKENEIYCSSRGEGQFISEGVFPRDQSSQWKEEEDDVEKRFIPHITSEGTLSLSSTTYHL